jgi:hypothetical protein
VEVLRTPEICHCDRAAASRTLPGRLGDDGMVWSVSFGSGLPVGGLASVLRWRPGDVAVAVSVLGDHRAGLQGLG